LTGYHQTHGLLTIGFFLQGQVLDGIVHLGDIPDVNGSPLVRSYHQVFNFIAGLKLAFHPDLVMLLPHFQGTGWHIQVAGGDHTGQLLQRETGGVQLFGVHVHVHVAFWCSYDGNRTDAINALQRIDHLFFQEFFQPTVALIGRYRIHQDGHHAGAQLEDGRPTGTVGQVVVNHVDGVPDVVDGFVQIRTPIKFHHDHRHVVSGSGGDFFDALHAVEGVFQGFSQVGFNFFRIGPRVGGHHGHIRRFHLRELVDGQQA